MFQYDKPHAKSRIDNTPQVRRKQKGAANDEGVGAVQIGEQMERQKMSASKSLTGAVSNIVSATRSRALGCKPCFWHQTMSMGTRGCVVYTAC